MPEPQQNDWFSQNAPPPPGAQDWFAANGPTQITPEQMKAPVAAAGVANPGVATTRDLIPKRAVGPQYREKPTGAMPGSFEGHPENLGGPIRANARYLPAEGMVVGGLLGSVEPGGGNVVGAALGGAAGVQTQRLIEGKPTTTVPALEETGIGAAQGAGSEMGGQIIGKGLEVGAGALRRALPASTKAAAGLFERGVAPGGLSAEDQALMRENFSRAAKYIAPETRGFPVAGGEGGAMRGAATAHRAADNLWQGAVEPVTELFKDVQRPGDDIASAIRSGFTELDRTTKPAAVNAGNDLAKFFEGRPVSVGEMSEYIKQLNNDRAVTRFYSMSPNEQVQAELADPSLRSKVTALHALREKMFDAIGESGGDRLGRQFAEARKDWGALRAIEDQVRGAKVPTPAPLWTRIGSTVRGAISPHGADFWMRPQETLLGINNPNRLITKSFNMLGRTDLRPPSLDVAPQFARGLLADRTITLTPQEPEIGASAPNAPQGYTGRFGTQAIVPHPNPSFRHNPPTGPNTPPIDVEHFDRWEPGLSPNNPLPSSGRTIITPRAAVEEMPGPKELPIGPQIAPQLRGGPERALPPINPRNASGAIEAGPVREPLITPPPKPETPTAQPVAESLGGAIEGPKKPLAPSETKPPAAAKPEKKAPPTSTQNLAQKSKAAKEMTLEEAKAALEKFEKPASRTPEVKAPVASANFQDIENMSHQQVKSELTQVRNEVKILKGRVRTPASTQRLNDLYDRAGKLKMADDRMEGEETKATAEQEKKSARAKELEPVSSAWSDATYLQRSRMLRSAGLSESVHAQPRSGVKSYGTRSSFESLPTSVQDTLLTAHRESSVTRELGEGIPATLPKKEFFQQAINKALKPWQEKLGPEGLEEARSLTAKLNADTKPIVRDRLLSLEKDKPSELTEKWLHFKVPGDGEFKLRNAPGVISEMAGRADDLFPKARPRQASAPRKIVGRPTGGTELQHGAAIKRMEEGIQRAEGPGWINPDTGVRFENGTERDEWLKAERENLANLKERLEELKTFGKKGLMGQ